MIMKVCASGGFKRESIRSPRFKTWPQSGSAAEPCGGRQASQASPHRETNLSGTGWTYSYRAASPSLDFRPPADSASGPSCVIYAIMLTLNEPE